MLLCFVVLKLDVVITVAIRINTCGK